MPKFSGTVGNRETLCYLFFSCDTQQYLFIALPKTIIDPFKNI